MKSRNFALRYFVPALVGLFCSPLQSARNIEDECLVTIREIYSQANGAKLTTTQGCHLRYKMVVVVRSPIVKKLVSEMDIQMNNVQAEIVTSEGSLYVDLYSCVAVNPEAKSIFISSSNSAIYTRLSRERLSVMQKDLLDQCSVRSCRTYSTTSNKKLTEAILIPSRSMQQAYQVNSIKIIYDSSINKLETVEVDYQVGHRYKSASYTIVVSDYAYPSHFRHPRSLDYVFGRGGGLLPAFRGYTITDTRR